MGKEECWLCKGKKRIRQMTNGAWLPCMHPSHYQPDEHPVHECRECPACAMLSWAEVKAMLAKVVGLREKHLGFVQERRNNPDPERRVDPYPHLLLEYDERIRTLEAVLRRKEEKEKTKG